MTTIQNTRRATALSVMSQSVQNGGGTFDLLGEPSTEGFAVTTRLLAVIEGRCINPDDIEKAAQEIFEAWRPTPDVDDPHKIRLGTWWDHENDRWEISETAVVADCDEALRLAYALGERFIYDLGADECVAVERERSNA